MIFCKPWSMVWQFHTIEAPRVWNSRRSWRTSWHARRDSEKQEIGPADVPETYSCSRTGKGWYSLHVEHNLLFVLYLVCPLNTERTESLDEMTTGYSQMGINLSQDRWLSTMSPMRSHLVTFFTVRVINCESYFLNISSITTLLLQLFIDGRINQRW